MYCRIKIANPNSLRPYHTTLGPAAGPSCSKMVAPPLNLKYFLFTVLL